MTELASIACAEEGMSMELLDPGDEGGETGVPRRRERGSALSVLHPA